MTPLTEKQLRACFVNASKREANQATLPDLATLDWDNLDYLGWVDRKSPLVAYAIVEVDGEPTGVLLRAGDAKAGRARRKGVCAWCEDVVVTGDVSLYVARRGGASGRNGNSIGTLICTDFRCHRNVRRIPLIAEAGTPEAKAELTARRIAGLRERAARFAREVASTR